MLDLKRALEVYISQKPTSIDERILLQKIDMAQNEQDMEVLKWPLWLGIIILATDEEVKKVTKEKEEKFEKFLNKESGNKISADDEDQFIKWFKKTKINSEDSRARASS